MLHQVLADIVETLLNHLDVGKLVGNRLDRGIDGEFISKGRDLDDQWRRCGRRR